MIEILNLIAQTIYDKKGFNILALDVRNVCSMTDYVIIAEGTVDRHLRSLAQELNEVLIGKGLSLYKVEGAHSGDWIVLDYGDIVIHLFIPEMREKYALEDLWKASSIVDVKINLK